MNETQLHDLIERLENRIMHLEAALDEITATLLRQEQLGRSQARLIEDLRSRLLSLAASSRTGPAGDPPPPHY